MMGLSFGIYFFGVGFLLNRKVLGFSLYESVLFSPLVMGTMISIASAPVLYFANLTSLSVVIIVSIPAFILLFFLRSKNVPREQSDVSISLKMSICTLVSYILSLLTIVTLFYSQTLETTLGPWDIVSSLFFVLVFLNLCTLLMAGIIGVPFPFLAPAISTSFFSIASVLAIVYPLGFGFDPLLHTAAERVISEHGILLPKTPYYNGHYGLMVILAKIFHAPLELFDRFFVVGIAALTLPSLFFRTYRTLTLTKKTASIATILVLSLAPFSPISSGTPWGHAFFYALVAILASVLFYSKKNKADAAILVLATGALFAIHPLAGLPLLGFLPYAFFKKNTLVIKGILLGISAFAVAGAFLILSKITAQLEVEITPFHAESLINFFSSFLPKWEWRFHAILDPVYLLAKNIYFLLLLASISSFILVKKTASTPRGAIHLLVFGFLGAALCYIITQGFISFPSLPIYEQTIYTDRIKEVALLFLSILGGFALGCGIEKIIKQKKSFFVFVTVLTVAAFGIIQVYASYPRNDAYVPYHGHTISRQDIEAVHWIQDHAGGKGYVVLSNQTTAAASIKEFGFAKYFSILKNGMPYEAFYYSIPTASPLHDAFTAMLAKPSGEIVNDAMSLFNVDRIYFVVHSYEPRFRNIIDKTKPLADEWYSIDNEKVTVFSFYASDTR